MTYDARETSICEGEPVECFRFTSGARAWLYTSADQAVSLPLGVFQPATISRGELEHSQEEISSEAEIHLPRTSEISAPFIAFVPTTPIGVSIFRAHRGGETDYVPIFIGVIGGVDFKGSEAVLRCVPISQSLKRNIPALAYMPACNWAVFSDDCGLDRGAWVDLVNVTTVVGNTITSNDFALRPDGWYNAGYLQRANGDVRFVVAHDGAAVTVMSAFRDLAPLERISAYPGCAGSEGACATKFDNLRRHFGFPRIPTVNPSDGRFV
jgi:uncharacterized phage protein (TIGR02218 family)